MNGLCRKGAMFVEPGVRSPRVSSSLFAKRQVLGFKSPRFRSAREVSDFKASGDSPGSDTSRDRLYCAMPSIFRIIAILRSAVWARPAAVGGIMFDRSDSRQTYLGFA